VNPIGRQIVLDKDAEFPQPITIVGVTGDVVSNEIGSPSEPQVAMPFRQVPGSSVLARYLVAVAAGFAVRADANQPVTAQHIRGVVKNEAPGFAIDNLAPLSEAVHKALRTQQLAMEIASAFAWIALLLSAAGLYGVLAYLVGDRIREIGIRLALGATRRNVFALVAVRGLLMAGAGLALGIMISVIAVRWIAVFLYGIGSHDILTYTGSIALTGAASAVATILQARRAAAVEPMEALRTE
jgi:ABC-type antimicrobial peptide transport system permease subunit